MLSQGAESDEGELIKVEDLVEVVKNKLASFHEDGIDDITRIIKNL